jgi:cytochrome c oxidase subunit III
MTTLQPHDMAHDAAHGHDDHHDHPPFLAHHWDNPKQQFEAGKLGMWLFLATEVLLFGGLFCAYSVWRGNHPELFKYGSHYLNTTMGAINTAVLILSSLTMAWGVTAAQKNQIGLLKVCLVLTLMGAAGFLVIKYFEYTHKFQEGLFPGIKFYEKPGEHSHMWVGEGGAHGSAATHEAAVAAPDHAEAAKAAPVHAEPAHAESAASAPGALTVETISITATQPSLPASEASTVPIAPAGPSGLAADAPLEQQDVELLRDRYTATVQPLQDPGRPHDVHMFFNIYYMMTGLHGIHVVIGMIVITWLLIKTFKGHFSSEYFTPVDLGGLYWHVVDLIWIFLFPLFYLI